jgi:hypothetical protein
MTRKSPTFFATEFLPTLNRVTSFTNTARVLNFDESSAHVWIRESKNAKKRGDDPSDYLFEYDGSRRYLHQHIKAVQVASISDIEANARARARDGYWRPCRFQGKTVWKEDPMLVGMDDRMLDMLGYPDRLLRINGELQPEMEWVPPSTDLVIAVLQANSETYRKRSSVDVNMNARVSGGVMMVGGPKQSPQIAAPLPVLEVLQDEIAEPERVPSDEVEPDLTVTDTDPAELPVAPVDDDDEDQPAPAPVAEPVDPGPRIVTPTPPEYAPGLDPILRPRVTGRPLSDLERDLLSKLPSSLNRAR